LTMVGTRFLDKILLVGYLDAVKGLRVCLHRFRLSDVHLVVGKCVKIDCFFNEIRVHLTASMQR
jgi:hypothetical protein